LLYTDQREHTVSITLTIGDTEIEAEVLRQSLTPRQLQAVLYTLSGYRQAEIAALMGCCQQRVSQLLGQSSKNLCKTLSDL
jgi:DNA-binding CsgD family transcriptional regulator